MTLPLSHQCSKFKVGWKAQNTPNRSASATTTSDLGDSTDTNWTESPSGLEHGLERTKWKRTATRTQFLLKATNFQLGSGVHNSSCAKVCMLQWHVWELTKNFPRLNWVTFPPASLPGGIFSSPHPSSGELSWMNSEVWISGTSEDCCWSVTPLISVVADTFKTLILEKETSEWCKSLEFCLQNKWGRRGGPWSEIWIPKHHCGRERGLP